VKWRGSARSVLVKGSDFNTYRPRLYRPMEKKPGFLRYIKMFMDFVLYITYVRKFCFIDRLG